VASANGVPFNLAVSPEAAVSTALTVLPDVSDMVVVNVTVTPSKSSTARRGGEVAGHSAPPSAQVRPRGAVVVRTRNHGRKEESIKPSRWDNTSMTLQSWSDSDK
jgi:hypothetical protein